MTLTFKSGDMFTEAVEALVNTVNCVGVMGKGVALEFKQRWPENFKAYKRACDAKELQPGRILIFENPQLFSADEPRFLVNFPTKAHWRSPSKLSYIEDGLDTLVTEIRKHGITSIAMPPLGCGNGGLDWADVKPLIAAKLGQLDDVNIVVFSPFESEDEPEFSDKATLPMNYPRAMLLKSLSELEVLFDGAFDETSLQKIVYFLQALGVDFKLSFEGNRNGPYSESLRDAFVAFEKHGVISGFSAEDSRSHATPAGCAAADDFLDGSDKPTDEIVMRLSRLIQGYENPYGLELLSVVHWIAHHEADFPVERVVEAMKRGEAAKSDRFDEPSIRVAFERLHDDELLK